MISRIVRDFLQRRSRFLLLCSALYLVLTLLAYSLAGQYGIGSFLLLFAVLLTCVGVGLIFFDYQTGFARLLLHLPVDPRAVAKSHWVLAVGIPTVWAFGLTLVAWLATAAVGRFSWLTLPMAVALSFWIASFVFFLSAIENSGRKFGGDSAPPWVRPVVWTLVGLAAVAGFYLLGAQVGYYVNRNPGGSAQAMEFWKLEHMLLLLALGAAASSLGFARARALLITGRVQWKSRWAAPWPVTRKRLPLARNLTGFAAITASCVWMPIAIAGALGAMFALDIGMRQLVGLSDSHPRMDWSDTVARAGIFGGFVVAGFCLTVPRFANFRILKGLPVSTRRLGACVTLLPAILVLIQVALAFPLLYVLDPKAAVNISLPLAGAVGIGALLCPALLVRPNLDIASLDIASLAGLVVIGALLGSWFTVSARVPVLQVLAPLVLAGGLFASWALSMLVFRYALAAADKPLPLQRVAPGGNA